ncbi:MAG: hypothetical protein N3A63_05165 [Bacteroidetes bacterium]|nr:hypothetical protein [Bacteroidota bacterium]
MFSYRSLLFSLISTSIFTISVAQPQKGFYGVSINLTNGFFTSQAVKTPAGPYTIGIVYLPSDQIRLRGDMGYRLQKNTQGQKESEFAFTANVWRYYATKENITPFLCGSLIIGSVSGATSTGLLGVGGGGGAEFWVSKRFSVYGQLHLIYGHYSTHGSSSYDIYTSATAGVCWYFTLE